MKFFTARSDTYPASQTKRFVVPDDKVDWAAEFKEYKPVDYTAEVVSKGPVWADADIRYYLHVLSLLFTIKFYEIVFIYILLISIVLFYLPSFLAQNPANTPLKSSNQDAICYLFSTQR